MYAFVRIRVIFAVSYISNKSVICLQRDVIGYTRQSVRPSVCHTPVLCRNGGTRDHSKHSTRGPAMSVHGLLLSHTIAPNILVKLQWVILYRCVKQTWEKLYAYSVFA